MVLNTVRAKVSNVQKCMILYFVLKKRIRAEPDPIKRRYWIKHMVHLECLLLPIWGDLRF